MWGKDIRPKEYILHDSIYKMFSKRQTQYVIEIRISGCLWWGERIGEISGVVYTHVCICIHKNTYALYILFLINCIACLWCLLQKSTPFSKCRELYLNIRVSYCRWIAPQLKKHEFSSFGYLFWFEQVEEKPTYQQSQDS